MKKKQKKRKLMKTIIEAIEDNQDNFYLGSEEQLELSKKDAEKINFKIEEYKYKIIRYFEVHCGWLYMLIKDE